MWALKLAKMASAGRVHLNYARCKLDATDRKTQKKSRLEVYVFYTENFPASCRFNFVRIDLKLSVKNFPASSTLIFFSMGFFEAKIMFSATSTRRRVERPKTKSTKKFDGPSSYLTGPPLGTEKYWQQRFQTQCSLLLWDEGPQFFLPRYRGPSSRIKISNARCITVSANGSLNLTSERVCFATKYGLNSAFGTLGYV